MLWSPSEVLAYMKDDKPEDIIIKKEEDRLLPTAAYGGFKTWSSPEQDFMLIAENSEIHGPNPLFTIPKLNTEVDLNLLSTLILSADYQGLSNNKILPGNNAQLLMPDLASDIHAAIVYFFLFDSDARGFVRPTCIAYFTSDKYKLAMLAEFILERLNEVASLLQHFNIRCTIDDLKSLQENLFFNKPTSSKSIDTVNELIQKDIQEVLGIVDRYKGNDIYDKQYLALIDGLKTNAVFEEIKSWITTPLDRSSSESHQNKLSCRPNTKTCMKDLYHICDKGVILSIYHLYISYQFLRRKYENISSTSPPSNLLTKKEHCLLFGACVKNLNSKQQNLLHNKCILESHRVPVTFSLEDHDYFSCLNKTYEEVVLEFLNQGKESNCQNITNSSELSSCDFISSSESFFTTSTSSGYLSGYSIEKEKTIFQTNCGHIVSLDKIWDTLENIKIKYPEMEETFVKILKLFGDSQRLLFSILTRSPIIIISTSDQLQDAIYFVTALSVLIPRSKREVIFVDVNRQKPLEIEDLDSFVVVNICLDEHHNVEELVPLELMPKMCILNLKDSSLTAPFYSGRLLADIDQRLKLLPTAGAVFPVFVGLLSEIELAISWWDMVSSSAMGSSEVSSYVLTKGYTRSDMQIIENLFKLWKS